MDYSEPKNQLVYWLVDKEEVKIFAGKKFNKYMVNLKTAYDKKKLQFCTKSQRILGLVELIVFVR